MSDEHILVLLSVLTSGLLVGTIFSVVAAGLSLIHGTILLPQAANGQVFLGAGLLFWLFGTEFDWPLWVSVPATFLIIAMIAFATEATILKRFYPLEDRNISYLIITLGIAQILSGVYTGTIGKISDTFQVTTPFPGFAMIEPVPIPNTRLVAFVLAAAVLGGLMAFLRLHRIGRALRAVFQNREAARLRGIDTLKIYRFAFLLGTMITTAGGILFALAFALDLTVGWTMSLITFSIMIVGGPGSVVGALCVGLVFGFTQAIVSVFADPTVSTFAYLLAMLAMLFVRPSGLFAK
ncbi:MAG: branched-chain amino acid ABC transporter permease [Bradyrhizobium sp.]